MTHIIKIYAYKGYAVPVVLARAAVINSESVRQKLLRKKVRN